MLSLYLGINPCPGRNLLRELNHPILPVVCHLSAGLELVCPTIAPTIAANSGPETKSQSTPQRYIECPFVWWVYWPDKVVTASPVCWCLCLPCLNLSKNNWRIWVVALQAILPVTGQGVRPCAKGGKGEWGSGCHFLPVFSLCRHS